MIIVAAIVVIAILIGGTVWYLNTSNSNGVQPATQSQETTKPKKKAKKADGKSSDKSGESDKSDKTGGSGKSSKAGESDESDKPGKSGKTDASKERTGGPIAYWTKARPIPSSTATPPSMWAFRS